VTLTFVGSTPAIIKIAALIIEIPRPSLQQMRVQSTDQTQRSND
jgi:hypothetical protein